MHRMTSKRVKGIGLTYRSNKHKDDLVQRLGEYEDIGLTPEEVEQLKNTHAERAGIFGRAWISDGWHDAIKNPPTDEEPVLAVVSGRYNGVIYDNAYMLGTYSNKYGWFLDEAPEWETPVVIEWQPLPKRSVDKRSAAILQRRKERIENEKSE